MSTRTDILIFVEDPGAANFVTELPGAFAAQGWRTRLLAAGSARGYLRQRDVPVESISSHGPAGALLGETEPRLVLVGTAENPDTPGLSLIARAREMGIESGGLVDGLANAEFRFSGRSANPLKYAPDWILVPDAWTQQAFLDLGCSAARLVVCGHPHYDTVRAEGERLRQEERGVLRQSLLTDRPIVVFGTEKSVGPNAAQYLRSPEYTLTGRGGSIHRTRIVLEEFLDALAPIKPRPYLILRLHPKETPDEYADYLAHFDCISQGGSALELMSSADIVVGMSSMLLLEAALLGRPTLSILPRAVEKTWLPTLHAELTPCVTTRAELRKTLMEWLCSGPPPPPANLDAVIPCGSQRKVVEFVAARMISEAFGRRPA